MALYWGRFTVYGITAWRSQKHYSLYIMQGTAVDDLAPRASLAAFTLPYRVRVPKVMST